MILHNDTLFRGYLAHVHANIKEMMRLYGERAMRLALAGDEEKIRAKVPNPEGLLMIRKDWEKMREDTRKVLGVELQSFEGLLEANTVYMVLDISSNKDPTRIRMRVLKKRADKARERDPSITLMKSWKLEDHEPEEKDR